MYRPNQQYIYPTNMYGVLCIHSLFFPCSCTTMNKPCHVFDINPTYTNSLPNILKLYKNWKYVIATALIQFELHLIKTALASFFWKSLSLFTCELI